MRVIVPGGYYSYDSAGKKIWLDYQYYGATLENIERVKNLTRNKVLYDCKLSKEPVTVSNGCITHSYSGTNTSYGLQNLSNPWISLYSPTDSLIDFYLFTHRTQSLSFTKDETGTIYSLSLYPCAGSVYHGQIPFADLTLDTNSNSVPDCLEAVVNGSVTKFLANYSMVI